MPPEAQNRSAGWTSNQAYVLAAICLVLGIGVGYLLRGSGSASAPPLAATAPQSQAAGTVAGAMSSGQVTSEQLKHMADKQAEPLLDRLKKEPANAELFASIGNLYYDAQQYQDAITYYQRSLQIQATNTSVRTDMGTAYWYLGDADKAISEFRSVLKTEPNKANALFNLGIVQWRGKMDVDGALATWQKLLDTNPGYENKEVVQNLIAQARKHSGIAPGTKTNKPAM